TIDHQHVIGAVAVDVGHQRCGTRSRGKLAGGGKRTVAVAQQEGDVAGPYVGDGQVEVAVPVEVARYHRAWSRPHGVGNLGLEGAITVDQQDRHGVVKGVGDGQVEVAIAVEVTRHQSARPCSHGVSDLVLEGAVAVAQQHGDVTVLV